MAELTLIAAEHAAHRKIRTPALQKPSGCGLGIGRHNGRGLALDLKSRCNVFVVIGLAFQAVAGISDTHGAEQASRCEKRGLAFAALYRTAVGRTAEKNLTDARTSLTKLLTKAVANHKIPGGVIEFGGVANSLWLGHGTLSKRNSERIGENTLYDLASLSKVVSTATCIHLLSDRGKIDLKAPISTYLAELGPKGLGAVPVERFLRHPAGRLVGFPNGDPVRSGGRNGDSRAGDDFGISCAGDDFGISLADDFGISSAGAPGSERSG